MPGQISRAEGRVGASLREGLTLQQVLAVGGLGTVFRARNSRFGAVAVKLLHDEHRPEIGDDFVAAAQIADGIGHPRAHPTIGDGAFENLPYVLSPLLKGENVASLIWRRGGMLPPAEALRITRDALEVLDAAHDKGVVHGALHPGHLFLDEDGEVTVLGFGEARLRAKLALASGFDPSAWDPPEHELASSPAERGDLWSLGAILFALLTGQSAYGQRLSEERYPTRGPQRRPFAQVAPRAPQVLVELVERCLAQDPAQRFPDAGTMRAAIESAEQSHEIHYAHALASVLAPPIEARAPTIPPHELRLTPPAPTPDQRPREGARPSASASGESAIIPTARRPYAPEPDSGRPESEPPVTPLSPGPTPGRRGTTPPSGIAIATPGPVIPSPDQVPKIELRERAAEPDRPDAPITIRTRREVDLTLGLVSSSEEETAALESVLGSIDQAVAATRRPADPTRKLELAREQAFATLLRELSVAAGALTLRVEPQSLVTALRPVWQPPGALEPTVAALHRAGVATIALLPGFDTPELDRLLALFASVDGGTDAPDVLTGLHAADFAHLLFHVRDVLDGVDPEARTEMDAERRRIRGLVAFDSTFQIEDAWQHSRRAAHPAQPIEQEIQRLADALGAFPSSAGAEPAPATDLERENDVEPLRLARIAGSAMEGPSLEPALAAFGPALRRHFEQLARPDPAAALELLRTVVSSVRAPKNALVAHQTQVLGAMASPDSLATLMIALSSTRPSATTLHHVVDLLPFLGAEHATPLAEALVKVSDPQLRAHLLHHLESGMSGHEAGLGALAARADARVGLALVRLLSRIDTLAARDAVDRAVQSPHAVVRIEALGFREGASGERLRNELRALLELSPPEQRIRNLRAIADEEVRVAAPFLAVRIRSEEFDSLEYEERRMLINALVAIAPARAEKLAVDLLGQTRLLSFGDHEDSRALAAEALGRVASSDDSRELLEEYSKKRWGSSEKVRDAATRALGMLRGRVEHGRHGARSEARASHASVRRPPQTLPASPEPSHASQAPTRASQAPPAAPEVAATRPPEDEGEAQ